MQFALVSDFALAATGCNYPSSLDSYTNKVTGDYLTTADINSRSCAIEKLESGPLAPNSGTITAPAYSFNGDPDTGMWRSAANTVDISAGGVRAAQFATTTSAVNYPVFQPAAAGGAPRLLAGGTDTNISIAYDTKGTGSHVFRRNDGGAEDGRFSAGVVLWGTTLATGSLAGEMILANNRFFRGVNTANNNTLAVIGIDSANRVFIAGNGSEIRWGTALVALGGGASATLGTIAGSGPTTAAQNSWMRVIDSGGSAFWVPAWK